MMLKNHLDMIGRNEPIQRKARFWQSYVRALKGTDDMRAPDHVSRPRLSPRGMFRPLLSEFPELSPGWPLKSMYEEPKHASDRISVPGYRYLPVSREIYGYSPRNLYGPFRGRTPATGYNDPMGPLSALDHLYPTKYPAVPHRPVTPSKELTPDEKERPLTPESELGYRYPGTFNPILMWKEHLDKMFPLYHKSDLYPRLFPTLEHRAVSPFREWTPSKAAALDHELGYTYAGSYNAIQAWQDHVARRAALDSWYPGRYPGRYPGGYPRYHSPLTEWRARPATPTEKQVGYNYAGQPIYTRGGLTRRPLSELLDPLPYMPMSRITRDPWWWEYPELRPFQSPYAYLHPSPFYLRDSFLSPVKRTYLWDKHPIRPFAHVY